MILILAGLGVASIFGTIVRIALAEMIRKSIPLSGEAFEIFFPDVLSNSLGCLLMGFCKKSTIFGRSPSWLQIFVTAGFCGSLTTFSAWMVASFQTRNSLFTFAMVAIGLAFSLPLYIVGAHAADGVDFLFNRKDSSDIEIDAHKDSDALVGSQKRAFPDRFLLWTMLSVLCLLLLLPAVFIFKRMWTRQSFACIFAPFGCLLRYFLTSKNIKWQFPWFTVLCNFIGTISFALSTLFRIPDPMVEDVIIGFKTGFCGCLTTVSSLTSDAFSMKRTISTYGYVGFSVLAGSVASLPVLFSVSQ